MRLMAGGHEVLVERWRELAAAHAAVTEKLEHVLHERHGLTVSEFEVLQRLAEAPAVHCRMQELADAVHLSQSALSRLIGRLEDDGYVNRAMCTDDRRGIYACLTANGAKLLVEAEPTQAEVLAETLPGA